jgi:acyl-CoA synthetase (NDP forming)
MHSLSPLLAPRGIAVVGVKGGPFDPTARDSMARRFLELLLRHGYEGDVYPVNPRYETVGQLSCYPSVADVPGTVDVAIVIAPKARVSEVVADCGTKGVRAVAIVSSGFAETGPQGKANELALVELARSHGIRVLGPNCFGYFNSHTPVNIFGSASLLTRELLKGSIGFVTQSGALAASVVDRAQERGIGFSCVITTGNQADVDNVEALELLIDDPHTHVVSMFMEGLPTPERFRAAVRKAAERGKPCLVLKTGTSEIARQAALTHTGSLVGNDALYDAVFRQEGVIRCEEPDDLFMTAALLSNHCVTAASVSGCGVAILSMSGAMGGILADAAERHGVTLADLSDQTRHDLSEVPGIGECMNPLDAAMATWASDFGVVGRLAGILASDEGVAVVVLALSGLPYAERLVDDCATAARAAGKAFVPIWAADRAELGNAMTRLANDGVTVYETPGSALKAIRSLDRYRRHQRARQWDVLAHLDAPAGSQRRDRAIGLLKRCGRTLAEHQSKQLLALYGIETPDEEIARSAAEAVTAADRLGYPIVLKINSSDLPHKTEAGGVALDLRDASQVRRTFETMLSTVAQRHPSVACDGVLVTRMAAPGIEMIAGAFRDPQFGPVVLTGFGGVLVEVLRDTTLRLAPVSESDVLAMLSELRGSEMLDGARERHASDRKAIVRILVALATMTIELRDFVDQVDINPLIVHSEGCGATVADALIVQRIAESAPEVL